MFAVVARTVSGRGAFRLCSRGVRVTHALLFSVALAVSPGVCGACASGCPSGGNATRRCPGTGVALFTLAAPQNCGSCCDAIPGGPLTGTADHGGASPTGGDAADGSPGACCHGGQGCRCLLEPRTAEAAVPPASARIEVGGPLPAAKAAIPPAIVAPVGVSLGGVAVPPPERPVRVLYGVWRN